MRSEHRYGRDCLRWRWDVESQPGYELSTFTTGETGERSRARPILTALAGRALEPGDEIDAEALIGRRIAVTLVPKESGYPRIDPDRPILSVEASGPDRPLRLDHDGGTMPRTRNPR